MADNTDKNENIESNWDEKIPSFDSLDLKEELLRGIYAYGFEKPSDIQQLAIKPTILGRDIIAQARSGTGKTGTFATSILQRIDTDSLETQAIVLANTRELVEQIRSVIHSIGTFLNVKVDSFIGGTSTKNDILKLQKGVQIVVGTPGRVEDLINRKALNLDNIKMFVLDEADVMLSSGFIEQVKKIFQKLPPDVQVALFSATLTPEVKQITQKFMIDPVKIYLPLNEQTLEGIPQYFVALEKDSWKLDVIIDLYSTLTLGTTIIFCNNIKTVDILSQKLSEKDFAVSSIHGNMDQSERESKLLDLRTGKTTLLITTDILARGIDVQQLSMVVNYELPYSPETYIHRIGRCGRHGRKGIAINLITPQDIQKLKLIESQYQTEINMLPRDLSSL